MSEVTLNRADRRRMDRQGGRKPKHPVELLSDEIRDLPLNEKARRTYEHEEGREISRARFRLKVAAQNALRINETDIVWSDTLLQATRSNPETDFYVSPASQTAFEADGLLFTLDISRNLTIVQFCGSCGVVPRLLPAGSVADLGKSLLHLDNEFTCKSCRRQEELKTFRGRGK